MERIEVPVLIAGAGPVGITLSLLLRRLGVASLLLEKRTGPQRAPAAHVVNARTFEICRQAGVDMSALAAAAKSPADAGRTYWVTRLGGEVLGSLPFECQGDDVLDVTPTPLRNLSQHRFEPILLDALQGSGAAPPRFGHRWLGAAADADGVTSSVVETATDRRYEVRSRYLIGADGAGSPIRKTLGIPQVGPERLQCFVMIHFEANLRPLVRDCPGVLYWLCDPECLGTMVAHDIDREWVLMKSFDPERESPDSYDRARCESLVRRTLARPDVDLAIRTVSPWVMSCQVAERYRDGRIFLAGDAAHRFPPTGGLGLNTGVQDAHNLAWKLAAVLDGTAPPALLDTYETERAPVARYNAEQSFKNALRLLDVPRALGFDDDAAQARRGFARVLADAARRGDLSRAIDDQAEHFDMLGLQLGFTYEAGALVSDASVPAPIDNPVRQFVPSSRPGARLPHGWLGDRAGDRSSLDLVRLDRLTLLTGADGGPWIDAARGLDPALSCVRIGADVADPDGWWTSVADMRPDGALLVRPDQHVAYRSRGAVADPRAALHDAVAAALCRGAQR